MLTTSSQAIFKEFQSRYGFVGGEDPEYVRYFHL